MADDDIPISFSELKTQVPWWPYSAARSYQLARAPGDGKPPLGTIKCGRRRFTTRRAMASFMAVRMAVAK